MRTIDLFAGIGGFGLATHWMGWETAAFVEWEPYCQDDLAKNFPNVPIYGDIDKFSYEKERDRIGAIDLICGGFPCQPFSTAGKRAGRDDERHKWPEMRRVIRECKPAWVVAENVAGIISMDGGRVFEEVCTDLESEGYKVQSFIIPAIAVGAPHRRDRIWIVAHSDISSNRADGRSGGKEVGVSQFDRPEQLRAGELIGTVGVAADATSPRLPQSRQTGERELSKEGGAGLHDRFKQPDWDEHWLETATRFCGMDDGLPDWMDEGERKTIYNAVEYFGKEEAERRTGLDMQKVEWRVQRTKRLKALGNAIVPQIAYEIFRAIEEVEKNNSLPA